MSWAPDTSKETIDGSERSVGDDGNCIAMLVADVIVVTKQIVAR